MRLDDKAVTQHLDHHPKPTPNSSEPYLPLLKEAVTSVDHLSKSIKEFPDGVRQAFHVSETACALSLGVGVIIGLLLTLFVRKVK